MADDDKRLRNTKQPQESTVSSKAAKAKQKHLTTSDDKNIWEGTIWGSRDSFVKDRMELEGYSAEAAEEFAAIWEQARRERKENPPEILRTR